MKVEHEPPSQTRCMKKEINNINILLLIFSILVACILASIFCLGWSATWKILLVPPLEPVFADFRTIQAAIYSEAQGFNPQLTNPSDPWQRTMNYPLIWLDIAKIFALDIEINFLIFNSFVILCYLVICFRLLQNYSSYYLLAIIFSTASLLAIERANNDLVIFILLFFSGSSPILIGAILIYISAVLKIYPALASIIFLNNWKILTILFVGIALYLIDQLSDLNNITRGNSSTIYLSYGAISTIWLLQTKIGILNIITASTLSYIYVIGLLSFAVCLCWRRDRKVLLNPFQGKDNTHRLFLIGSSIYIGTFVLSSNWDYRLVFLIFCIPYIQDNLDRQSKYFLLTCILVATNQIVWEKLFGMYRGQVIGMIAKSLIFIMLVSIYQNVFIYINDVLKKCLVQCINRISK
jgi:hypothetical protein